VVKFFAEGCEQLKNKKIKTREEKRVGRRVAVNYFCALKIIIIIIMNPTFTCN